MSSKPSDNMLSKMALDAMSKSLSLAATVLGFDIVELWSDGGDGKGLHCTFVHASDELIAKHPSIIYGYYPKHQRAHLISPLVSPFPRHPVFADRCPAVRLLQASREEVPLACDSGRRSGVH